jgi:hypothetical protein
MFVEFDGRDIAWGEVDAYAVCAYVLRLGSQRPCAHGAS